MNLAIRGIDAYLGPRWGDSFHEDLDPDLKADYILANPPFNISDWGGDQLRDDARWQYGVPPAGNANYAWLQHLVYHFSPRGVAGMVLANGSLSSQQSGEGDIRQRMIEADLVECVVAMPGQLFYSTQIPASLWFLNRDKTPGGAGHGATGAARRCLSMRGSSARWSTAHTVNSLTRISLASRSLFTDGVASQEPMSTRTFQVSAHLPIPRRSPRIGTC